MFNERYYIQEWGTAIETRVAPTYANIFMGWLEEKLIKGSKGTSPHLWKRYIDDVFSVWRGTEQELLQFQCSPYDKVHSRIQNQRRRCKS